MDKAKIVYGKDQEEENKEERGDISSSDDQGRHEQQEKGEIEAHGNSSDDQGKHEQQEGEIDGQGSIDQTGLETMRSMETELDNIAKSDDASQGCLHPPGLHTYQTGRFRVTHVESDDEANAILLGKIDNPASSSSQPRHPHGSSSSSSPVRHIITYTSGRFTVTRSEPVQQSDTNEGVGCLRECNCSSCCYSWRISAYTDMEVSEPEASDDESDSNTGNNNSSKTISNKGVDSSSSKEPQN